MIKEKIQTQILELGDSTQLEALDYFRDPERRTMTFKGESADVLVATVTVEGSEITIHGVNHGIVVITLTATDNRQRSVTQSFEVTVGRQISFVENIVSGREGSTVIATDSDGFSSSLSFEVIVEPMPRSMMQGWRRALLEELGNSNSND